MHVRNLAELDLADWGEFGGKAAHLGHAARLGCPVLRGVAISTRLFQRFVEQGGLLGEVSSILNTMQPRTLAQFHAAAWAIRSAFKVRRLPNEVRAELVSAWEALGAEQVGVRSSATNEDSVHRSFIGQHVSTLNVNSADALVAAALDSWNSLFSAKSLAYAQRFGVDLLTCSMGLVVQPMITAEMSGALFTVDPITGDPDRFILEIHQGPERGVFDLDPYVRKPGELSFWSQLRYYGLLLDEHDLAYQAIEWVISDNDLSFLRVRPATAVPSFLPAKELPERLTRPYRLMGADDVPRRALRPLSHYAYSRIDLGDVRPERFAGDALAAPQYVKVADYLYQAISDTAETARSDPSHFGLLAQGLRVSLAQTRLDQQLQERVTSTTAQIAMARPAELGDSSGPELADLIAEIQRLGNAAASQGAEVATTIQAQRELLAQMHRQWAQQEVTPLQLLADTASALATPEAIRELWQRDIMAAPWSGDADVAPQPAHNTTTSPTASANLNPMQRRLYQAVLERARRLQGLLAQVLDAIAQARSLEQQAVLEAGRRLRAIGAAVTEQDFALLEARELARWLRDELPDEQVMRWVLRRRDTQRRAWRYSPPVELVVSSTVPGADLKDCDLVLKGRAVSAGLVTGRARVIRSLGETSSVLPNEVLICHQATFELSPLFSTVAALVTETGALLDSGSVLAREYGVPAVFAVPDAIAQLHTGDELVVDAVRGMVGRRAARPSAHRNVLSELNDLD